VAGPERGQGVGVPAGQDELHDLPTRDLPTWIYALQYLLKCSRPGARNISAALPKPRHRVTLF
jgi:hypothetical protein